MNSSELENLARIGKLKREPPAARLTPPALLT